MKEIVTLLQCAEGGVQRRQRKQPADNLLLRKMRWEAVGRAAYDVLLVDVRRRGYQTATGGRSGGEAAAAAGLHYAREWLWIGWVAQNGSTGGVTTAASTLPTDLWENKVRGLQQKHNELKTYSYSPSNSYPKWPSPSNSYPNWPSPSNSCLCRNSGNQHLNWCLHKKVATIYCCRSFTLYSSFNGEGSELEHRLEVHHT